MTIDYDTPIAAMAVWNCVRAPLCVTEPNVQPVQLHKHEYIHKHEYGTTIVEHVAMTKKTINESERFQLKVRTETLGHFNLD